MRKIYMFFICKKTFALSLFLAIFSTLYLNAQTTLTTLPNPPYNATNGAGSNTAVTFVIENTNSFPVLLNGVSTWLNTADANSTLQLWYSSTSLSGAPTIATPDWTQIAQVTNFPAPATSGITPVWTTLGFTIPAGTQYRFAVWYVNIGSHYSGTGAGTVSPSTFSGDGVILKLGDVQIAGLYVGYGGVNNPRWWTGAITFQPAGPCTSPPVAGTVTSTANPACPNANFTLSLTGGTGGTGQTYQWQSSPGTSGPWANIAGATNGTLTTSQTTATYYRCYTTCGAATDTSISLLVTVNPIGNCYCIPQYSTGTGSGDYCTLVQIPGTTLDNPTGASPSPYYTLYPQSGSTTCTLVPGVSYSMVVRAGTFGSNDIAAWIDYNQNGLFEASELIGEVYNMGANPATSTFNFTVPITPFSGTMRLRVREADQGTTSLDPCLTYTFGETEDYDITIIPAVQCAGTPTGGSAASSKANVCSGESFTLSLNGASLGLGLTYQWQSSPDNINWTNIGGATTTTLGTSQTASTYYRCIVTCTNSSLSDTSTNVLVNSPLLVSGNFTINSGLATGGTNFQTFADAIDYIKCGIGGPVVFTLEPGSGPYNEQVVIPAIFGTSATNTVTFKGNLNTLVFNSSNTNARAGIFLNGARHIIIDSLIINGMAGTYGWGVHLMNAADSNQISNCTINVSTTNTTSVNHSPVVISGSLTSATTSGNNGNYNIITGNTLTGGYYGIVIYGNSAAGAQNLDNIVSNNKVRDTYSYGIYSAYQSGALISRNEITRPGRNSSTTTAGVFMTTGNINCLVEKNRVHNMFDALGTSTSTAYGIYVSADAAVGQENKVINNLIYNIGGNGTIYGIYNTGGNYMQAWHNTISLDDADATSGETNGIYQTGAATGIEYINNIVVVSRTGTGIKRCIRFVTTTSSITSNNNVLYMNAGAGADNRLGQFGTTSYAILSDWQTANSNAYDQQSISDDPTFANPVAGDYTPFSTAVDNIGTPLPVTTDINNMPRDPATPDAGAFEFVISPGINMGAQSLIEPAITNSCYTQAETVTIKIRNWSITPINFATNPVTVTVNVTGAATQTLTGTVNSGILSSGDTLYVTMAQPLDMTATGIYTFKAYTSVAGDVYAPNDSMNVAARTKVPLTAPSIVATPSSYCVDAGTPTLSATGGNGIGSIQWQQSPNSLTGFSDIPGATSDPYTLTNTYPQTMYYRVVASCGILTAASTEDTVMYFNPEVLSTTPGLRCGTGSVTLQATGSAGSILNWYAAPTGGNPISSGNSFSTPSLSTTTTYYVAAGLGASPPDSVAVPLSQGATTGVYHHMFLVSTTTDITVTGLGIKCNNTVGTLTAWDIYYRPDNFRNVPGANTSSAGWTLVSSVTNIPSRGTSDYTPIAFGLSVAIPAGSTYSFYIAPVGSSTHQYGTATPATVVGSNAYASIMAGNRGSSLFNCTTNGGNPVAKIYYTTGCSSLRIPVDAIISDSTRVLSHPSNQLVCAGNTATFNVTVAGSGLNYQWRKDGTPISGATSSDLILAGVSAADAGSYDVIITGTCGADTSDAATLSLIPPPVITAQPSGISACVGDNVTFTVEANTTTGALAYKWRKNGTVINGAASSAYTINNVTTADAASYDVIVYGSCDSVISIVAMLTLKPPTTITTQPSPQAVCVGDTALFSAAGSGSGSLAYQWRKAGVNINGATASSYTIPGVTASDAGNYDVVITGDCGSTTSISVALSIKEAAAINFQPVSQTVCPGDNATFNVLAAGANLIYQWRKDGADISGANSATYTITGVTAAHAGNYDVVISGDCNMVTSATVVLGVNPNGTWTGLVNADWNLAANWCGGVPTAITDVVIPASAPFMPILSNGSGSARNISISNGATLTIGASGILELYSNISGAGAFDATTGSITFKGASAQSLPGFTAVNVTMNGAGGVTPAGNASITGTLTLTNGNITLGNNNLALANGSTGSVASHIITNGTGHVVLMNLAASQTRTVPVGTNASGYNPVTLSANSGHVADNFTIRAQPGVYVNGVSGSTFNTHVADRMWIINEGTTGGSNVNVTLQWSASEELPSFERINSYVMQYDGTGWVDGIPADAAGTNPYTQTRMNVSSFSSFAIESPRIPTPVTSIYPNPTGGDLNVVTRLRQSGNVVFSIYDTKGSLLYRRKETLRAGLSQTTLQVAHLSRGVYVLKVSIDNDREFIVQRFVKMD